MTDRQVLVQQILDHEGLELKLYHDTEGVPTIGVGRNLRDVGISKDEALVLLDHDLDAVIEDCLTFVWFPTLDTVRQRAVIDLRFNVGPNGFRLFRHFIASMAQKNYPNASLDLQASQWANQVSPDRVKRLRTMIESGED